MSWTIETLKEYVESRFDSHDLALRTALAAHEKRLETMNEIRGQLQDQAITFMPRAECDRAIQALSEKIDGLKAASDGTAGTFKGIGALWVVVLGAVSIGSLIVSFLK